MQATIIDSLNAQVAQIASFHARANAALNQTSKKNLALIREMRIACPEFTGAVLVANALPIGYEFDCDLQERFEAGRAVWISKVDRSAFAILTPPAKVRK